MKDKNALEIVVTMLLAAFGALAHLLSQKEKTAVKFAGMISGCCVASFSGIMTYFISEHFGFGSSLMFIIAGISGWIGPHILDVFANIVLKKSGLDVFANPQNMSDSHNEKKQ